MRMIDINRTIPTVLARVKSLQKGNAIRIATFKKDRHITIRRVNNTVLRIIRHGFTNDEYELEEAKLKKEMKTLLKQEFPRSNKVHLTSVSADERE
ncbi:hypothetical protein [Halodesulfovibrio sp.]|jgi:hypothetical protein|uniref:hypothetical protein n=1 Tax=Halodesulfovibrio sp. TaxID=1912772 RepID=UPI0025CBC84A|nr:hypothetical protein [Halodesulfovibrio sp.]MCT4535996.1 hypothetical protein [Halodesulfovibrio sp.]